MKKEYSDIESYDSLLNGCRQMEVNEAITRLTHTAPDVDVEWQEMRRRINASRHKSRRVILMVAAAAACILCFVVWHAIDGQTPAVPEGAVIVANNGDTAVMIDNGDGNKTMMKGTTYKSAAVATANPRTKTVTTPRGKDCNVVLPDGSRVWLNADSRLVFPESFIGKTRSVRLEGEAYFEVAHDKAHPFVVDCEYFVTTVRGTVFNVRAFSAKDASVALVEGKVDVSSKSGGSNVLTLSPGHMAYMSSGELTMTETDTYPYTQRKAGLFYFHDATLLQIMLELGRWYNKTVVFENREMMNLTLHFVAERSQSLNATIRQLNEMDNIDIREEDDGTIVIE